jgi:superfamily I DNA/RNA helicase
MTARPPLQTLVPFEPDAEQRLVLEHTDGPLLVTGAAGTGKTAVLRERFARLIEGGHDPERIALVVGSRRARDEARAALLARLGRALPDLPVVTIHGLAFHVLGDRFGHLGYAAPPTVLDSGRQFARVRELLAGEEAAEWPAYGALLPLRVFADQVRQFVTRAQEALLAPEEIERRASEAGLTGWHELAVFLREYLDVLAHAGEVDFAGLVRQAAEAAWLGDPPFDHVLVDDHHDATLATEWLLSQLRATSLVVAGDSQQHVFAFQGASDRPLLRFAERNAGAAAVELATRHRPAHVPIVAWRAPHISEEHAAVARELRRIHVEEGVAWGEVAVVVRREGAHAEGLRRALDDAGIPRGAFESGSPSDVPATRPFVLAFRWIAASSEQRDAMVESVLVSELGRIPPAAARSLLRLVRAHGGRPGDALELRRHAPGDVVPALDALDATLGRAAERRSSALDAFRILWHELPYPRSLV